MSKERQEMIEKGKQLFKSKASSDEAQVWKESSLKYQAKYEESLLINQEIKLLLQSCLTAKESLIKDLAEANELIFQKELKKDSKDSVFMAAKATQTTKITESHETQTDAEIILKIEATAASTQTMESIDSLNESNENVKSQLSHIRDAYERAQSQMQLLGNANAQLKMDLENEKKITALLEAEVNTLPDYIQKYHSERKTLLEKLMLERQKVENLTKTINGISNRENSIESNNSISGNASSASNSAHNSIDKPITPKSDVSTDVNRLLGDQVLFSSPRNILNVDIQEIISQNDQILEEQLSRQEKTKDENITKSDSTISPESQAILSKETASMLSEYSPSKVSPQESLGSAIVDNVPKTISLNDSDTIISNSSPSKVSPVVDSVGNASLDNGPHAIELNDSDTITSNSSPSKVSPAVDSVVNASPESDKQEYITHKSRLEYSPDIKDVIPIEKDNEKQEIILQTDNLAGAPSAVFTPESNDTDVLSANNENIPLALLYGQSICHNCQYYKDISL